MRRVHLFIHVVDDAILRGLPPILASGTHYGVVSFIISFFSSFSCDKERFGHTRCSFFSFFYFLVGTNRCVVSLRVQATIGYKCNSQIEERVKTVWGIRLSSSKFGGVKRASPGTPMKLGLEMCVILWGTLIQACLTQYQVRVRMSQKKVPKMAVFGVFLPKNHLKLGVEPWNFTCTCIRP